MSKDFVEDGLTNEKIFEIVSEIREVIEEYGENEKKKEELKKKYIYFETRYPFLFDVVTKKEFDKETFEYMMKMRSKIIEDKISSEEASKKVGKKFYNKYQK